jgi:ABC-type sugar transport system permease subunit
MKRDRLWKFQYRAAPYLFIAPFLILFAVFMVYPLCTSFALGFYRTEGARHHRFIGLENYRYLLLHDRIFGLAVANTAGFTAAFLLLQVPISLGLAVLLNSPRVRWRSFFRFTFFSSYLVGQVFVAVVFFQLFSSTGLINQILHADVPWLTRPSLILPSVLLADLWLTAGYGMIYFLAALQAVDHELYEAAHIDGAGPWQSFIHITLPGIRPVMIFIILVGTIGGFQLFELPYVLLQGPGPNYRGLTIVMYLFIAGFNNGDLGYAAAIGWLLVAILLLTTLAQLRLFRVSREG